MRVVKKQKPICFRETIFEIEYRLKNEAKELSLKFKKITTNLL